MCEPNDDSITTEANLAEDETQESDFDKFTSSEVRENEEDDKKVIYIF